MARLSPAERAAPAFFEMDIRRDDRVAQCAWVVDSARYPRARRIVVANPDFFDPALPPTALQLIVVDFEMFLSGWLPWQRQVGERLRSEMDYAALAALLEKH